MKKYLIFTILLTTCLIAPSLNRCLYAADLYDKMAVEICEGGAELTKKKVAILPFAYVDGRKSPGGTIVSERLTTRIIKLKKLQVVERSLLEKVMEELKLQATGAIDSSSAKELGKLLGVEAIVVGSLMATREGQVEINARLIRTETAEAIVASNVTIERDWAEEVEEVPPGVPPVAPPRYVAPVRRAPTGPRFNFFDVLVGVNSNKITELKFKNTYYGVKLYTDLGIIPDYYTSGTYNSISWKNMATGSSTPLGFRIGGFGPGPLGGAFEFSYESNNMKRGTYSLFINDIKWGTVNFPSDDYLTVKSLILSGDLLIWVPAEKVFPYFGTGFGFSLNFISLPTVKSYITSTSGSIPTDDVGLGLILRFPFGLRVKIPDLGSMFAEARYQMHWIFFDRNRKYESDSITLSGFRFLFGAGFSF